MLIRAQHFLPHGDIVIGRRVEEAAGFAISAAPKKLFACFIPDTNRALNDPRRVFRPTKAIRETFAPVITDGYVNLYVLVEIRERQRTVNRRSNLRILYM